MTLNHFTEEQRQSFESNPVISQCFDGYFLFTEAYYRELYAAWEQACYHDKRMDTIMTMLEKDGIFPEEFRTSLCEYLDVDFCRYDEPKDGKEDPLTRHPVRTRIHEAALVMSGVFEIKPRGIGLTRASLDFVCEEYPERSMAEILEGIGLDPGLITPARMASLKSAVRIRQGALRREGRTLPASYPPLSGSGMVGTAAAADASPAESADDAAAPDESSPVSGTASAMSSATETAAQSASENPPERAAETQNAPEKKPERPMPGCGVTSNPYVESWCQSSVRMKEAFYNEAQVFRDLPVAQILRIYGIDPAAVSPWSQSRIRDSLMNWTPTETVMDVCSQEVRDIQVRCLREMTRLSEAYFAEIRENFRDLAPSEKKTICEEVADFPVSELYGYSRKTILEKCGIPQATFYKALGSARYGKYEEEKRIQDDRDIELIRQVIAYKGFRKGSRQIYMMLPDLTGEHFALSKIRRLMNKYGIVTGIRRSKRSVAADQMLTVRNRKENLLDRRFRLARPNEIRLTDVTYLNYGDHKRAYASSCIDPVTGKLIAFNTSEHNDLQLAMETLNRLSDCPAVEGALFHSDQGILYMTDEFQNRVKELGFRESMSERGICFDNAPQESFFGHFKDEVVYENCGTYEEVRGMIEEYAPYYNNERRQWSRKQMTPVEYEKYMLAMTEEEFAEYMRTETEAYEKMKREAAQKAIKKAEARKAAVEAAYRRDNV